MTSNNRSGTFEEFTSDLVIPSGWVNVSWHNDACSSYVTTLEGEGLHIFIDHQDPKEREPRNESMPRFFISRIDDEGLGVGVWVGNDWEKAKSVMEEGPENAPDLDPLLFVDGSAAKEEA